ncbi:V4R domain-containing protein [Methanolobus sp. ZRKC2]|uniref:V4R domain-containing protein n=1 Tax=Methanolobus sp. ZRKC2 TaxID=3125783 RepID=UPI0032569947
MVRDLCMFSKADKESEVVWFKISYENTVHSEADITSLFAEKELDMRFAYLDSLEDPSRGKYVIFTEVEKGRDVSDIIKELQELDVVLDVEYGISKNQVMQSVEFPLSLFGERAIILRASTFVDILKIVNENVSQAEGVQMLTGIKSGTSAVRLLRKVINIDENNCFDLLRELFMAAGWGIIEYDVDIRNLKGTIRTGDCFIADTYKNNEVPVCAYISGFFAGFISEVTKRTVQVYESQCLTTGHTFCEHVISPVPEGTKHVPRGELD